jgi:hypothetical protein
MTYRFVLPVYVDFPISERARTQRNKDRFAAGKPYNRKWLNLNWYRNAHHHETAKAKTLFHPIEVPDFFKADRIKITYSAERKSNVLYDLMNVISIVDKFFLDWLVSHEYIPDDNRTIVFYGAPTAEGGNAYDRVIVDVEVLKSPAEPHTEAIQQSLL